MIKQFFKIYNSYSILLIFLLSCYSISSCATKHVQFGKDIKNQELDIDSVKASKIQTFYFVGNTADISIKEKEINLKLLQTNLDKADTASYLVFLGDGNNINLKRKKNKFSKEALIEDIINIHLDIAQDFKGNTLFIPGKLDWELGLGGLKLQEQYVTEKLSNKNYFLPKDGCGIGSIKITDKIGVITVDSQWVLENWDDHPDINENCEIKTKEDFYFEFESLLNQFQDRTTLVVLHHPLKTNSVHGGKFSFKDQLFPFGTPIPLPVVGTIVNLIRSTGGLSIQDLQNVNYREFASRLSTLIQERDNIITVSGHDQNLQYIIDDNFKQIISGAISDSKPAKISGPKDFSYGGDGFVSLDVFEDGSSVANFYGFVHNSVKLLYSSKVTTKRNEYLNFDDIVLDNKIVETSIYPKNDIEKSKLYKFLIGNLYRDIYGKTLPFTSISLTEIYGGLSPVRMEKGSRTSYLKLTNKDENRFYYLEPVKKSATAYIQYVGYKNNYIANEFKNTFSEKVLLDFYTSSHPFYPLVIPSLQESIGIFGTPINLFYLPKQGPLNEYNKYFGNEVYMLHETPTIESLNTYYGQLPNKIIGTEEMLNNVKQDRNIIIDKDLYLKNRLFDLLVGDWNRGANQWNWAEYSENGKTIYRPLPKKRDQIFSKFDGFGLEMILGNQNLSHLQNYKEDISDIKGLNSKVYTLDLAILEVSDLDAWYKQAAFIQDNLTEEIIRNAFKVLPSEIKSDDDERVIKTLLKRKDNLQKFAKDYHKILLNTVVIKATNNQDKILVTRKSKGVTNVKIFDALNNELYFDQDFNKKNTKEIRIYGLNDQDLFKVEGKAKDKILVRLIGGIDSDFYDIKTPNKVKVYDYKNGNSIENLSSLPTRRFMDDYEINTYDYKTPNHNSYSLDPNFGFNPDDGLKVGLSEEIILKGFESRPYSQKHIFSGDYFFATKGFDLNYQGTFMKAIGKWNIDASVRYTTPTFSRNFFGLGNNTINNDEKLGLDYNRVRQRSFEIGPSFYRIFRNKARLDLFANYNYIKVENTVNRIVHTSPDVNPTVFDGNHFTEVGANYMIKNYDNESLPTLGMTLLANAKWIMNNDYFDSNFMRLAIELGFIHKITTDGKLTFASMLKFKSIIGSGFEFYQAVTVGGDEDLRGYRDDRFAGNRSYIQTSDLRYDLFRLKFGIPLRLGVFGGFDYGRVWYDDEYSHRWHTSYGGGIWLNGAQMVTAKISYFKGSDAGRFVFGLNFDF